MPATISKITPDPERHSRKCSICNHEKREEIDEKYLDWAPIGDICGVFGLEERNLYRHVQAMGLDEKKRQNTARYLQRIMERVPLDQITGSEALTAARLLLQMEGKLITRVDQKTEVTSEGMSKEERRKEYAEVLKMVRNATAGKEPLEGLEGESSEEFPTETDSLLTRRPLGPKKI